MHPLTLIIYFHFWVETSQWTRESEQIVKYYVYALLIWRNAFQHNRDYTVFQFKIKFVLKDSLAMGRPWWNKFGWSDSCKWILPIEQSKLVHGPHGQQDRVCIFIGWIVSSYLWPIFCLLFQASGQILIK